MVLTDCHQDLVIPILQTKHHIYFDDARNIKDKLSKNSVHLIITSPPYWQIKNYNKIESRQIGFNDSLDEYFRNLNEVWKGCIDVLKPGCKLCINIGDQFLQATKKTPYQIIPLHARLVNAIALEFSEMVYLGSINWYKVTTSNTSGGGKVMGSVYTPRNGYFFINHEYVAIFKKKGKDPKPKRSEYKDASRFTIEQRREWFKDTWHFPGVRQDRHLAMFPEKLPYRLMRMYSFVGDTVLDPFTGSGTTNKVAAQMGRHSKGFELGFETHNEENWKEVIKRKVNSSRENLDPTIPFLGPPNLSFHSSSKNSSKRFKPSSSSLLSTS